MASRLLPLLVLLAVPGGSAVTMATDAASDASWADDAGTFPYAPLVGDATVDLASLDVEEDAGGFWVTVQLHPPGPGQTPTPGRISAMFRHGNASYQVAYSPAQLYAVDATTGERRLVTELAQEGDFLSTFSAYVERMHLIDEDGSPPFDGRLLEDWRVFAEATRISHPAGGFSFQDRMPDEGVAEQPFSVSLGSTGVGGLRLYSSRPIRGSNGEATSFLYPVVAANDGSQAKTVTLAARSVPAGWQVHFEPATFALGPGELLTIPVIASIPFRHQHGSSESVELVMAETGGPGSASLSVGVSYFAVPQPAGHHDTLTIHSHASGTSRPSDPLVLDQSLRGFMSTLAEDAEDTGEPMPGFVNGLVNSGFRWTIALNPPLAIGLDFDLTRTGTFQAAFETEVPVVDGELTGTLYLRRGETDLVIANVTPVAVDLEAAGQTVVESTIVGTPAADFILDEGQARVFLVLTLGAGRPVAVDRPEAPRLLPGSTLTLPLNEYRDPVDSELLNASRSSLVALSPLQRQANPGDSLLFQVRLTNTAPEPISPRIQLVGVNAGWGQVLGAPAEALQPGESQDLNVVVRVPGDAGRGETADFFVSVTDADSASPSLARLVVIVDTTAQHADDADQIAGLQPGDAKESPGLPVALALLAAVAAARARTSKR